MSDEEGAASSAEASEATTAAPSEGAPSEALPSEVLSEGVEAGEGGEEGLQHKTSHVRMQAPEEKERRLTGTTETHSEPRDSLSRQRSSTKRSVEDEKEGILRRRSDRPSKAKQAVGSVLSIGKAGGYGDAYGGTKVPRYMNTYKLDSDNPFNVEKVENILKDVLIEALDNLVYDSKECPKQAKWASSAIRARIKELEFDRYKFVVLVTIGEKHYHDMACVVRFLWDLDRDGYAMFVHDNMSVFGTALCFAIYFE